MGKPLPPARRKKIEAAIRKGNYDQDIARALSASPGTVRNIRRALGIAAKPSKPPASPKPSPAPPPTTGEHRQITRLRDEILALKTQLRDSHRQALDDERIASIIGALSDWRANPPDWLTAPAARAKGITPEVPVMMFSDWHFPEIVLRSETRGANEYNEDIFEARVRRVVQAIIRVARDYGPGKYPGAVVCLTGDFLSGALHDELLKTDALEPIPSVLKLVDVLAAALRLLADAFGKLFVPCVFGNHGRTTRRIEFKREHAHSLDWLIYQLLAREFARDKRITIVAPPEGEVRFRVYGRRYLLMHGHELGVKGGDGIIGAIGPIMRGVVKVGRQNAAFGADFDMVLMGHWHQMLWLPGAIVANALKGFDEYAFKALRAVPTPPSQPLWFVHPRYGETSKWEIRAETGEAIAREWCSIESVRAA